MGVACPQQICMGVHDKIGVGGWQKKKMGEGGAIECLLLEICVKLTKWVSLIGPNAS